MQTEETILLSENPEWRLVLQTYFQAEQELPAPSRSESAKAKAAAAEAIAASSEVPEAENAEHEKSAVGWLPRLRAVAGVASELLSSIHGGLIAAGLLRFELFGRDGGLRYRTTPQGKTALKVLEQSTSVEPEESVSEETPLRRAA